MVRFIFRSVRFTYQLVPTTLHARIDQSEAYPVTFRKASYMDRKIGAKSKLTSDCVDLLKSNKKMFLRK